MLEQDKISISQESLDFLEKLNALDFGPLAYKLIHAEDRPGLSLEQSIEAIKIYKGFLFLCHMNNGISISPSRYIDYVWHTHLLDTELYAVQTAYLFGHYLHHFPFFGKRDDEDKRFLLEAASRTRKQASFYFGWDEDDWCGTTRPKWPFPPKGHTDIIDVIFPAGATGTAEEVSPDVFSFHAGNFRCTVEHFANRTYSSIGTTRRVSNRQEALESLLKLPPWVIVCMPKEDYLGGVFQVNAIERLPEIAIKLVDQRVSAKGFANEQVAVALN